MSEQAAGPAPADSRPIGDRIASVFGDIIGTPVSPPEPQAPAEPTDQAQPSAEATSEAQPAETAPDFAEVEYDGEKFTVPVKLKEAIIRQSDYTQKTQQLAEQRRALEHAQSSQRLAALQMDLQREVGPSLQQLAQIDTLIRQKAQVDLSSMTPDELARTQLEITQLNLYKDQLSRQVNEKQQQFLEQRQKALSDLQTKAQESLRSMIPTWNEDAQKAVLEHALQEGYTQEELNDIYDPRYVRTLWKAAQYDALQKAAKPAVQQAKAVQVKPSNPMPPETKQYLNWRNAMKKAPEGSRERTKLVESRVGDIFSR